MSIQPPTHYLVPKRASNLPSIIWYPSEHRYSHSILHQLKGGFRQTPHDVTPPSPATWPQCHTVDLSRAFHPAPFSRSPFLCPDTPAPSAAFHSFTLTSDHILHLHASPHPVCKLLPHLPGPGLWPHVYACPLISFHTETRETAEPTTGLCQPHLQTPSSFSEETPPPFLAWTSPWRCLLAAHPPPPLPPQPRCSSQGSWITSHLLSAPLVPGMGAPGLRSYSSPFLKEATLATAPAPQPLPGSTAGEITALTLSLPAPLAVG